MRFDVDFSLKREKQQQQSKCAICTLGVIGYKRKIQCNAFVNHTSQSHNDLMHDTSRCMKCCSRWIYRVECTVDSMYQVLSFFNQITRMRVREIKKNFLWEMNRKSQWTARIRWKKSLYALIHCEHSTRIPLKHCIPHLNFNYVVAEKNCIIFDNDFFPAAHLD